MRAVFFGFVADGFGGSGELFFGVGADADEVFGSEGGDDFLQMRLAGFVDRHHTRGGDFIGCEIGAGVFHPDERAEVGDKVIGEEVLGLGIFF